MDVTADVIAAGRRLFDAMLDLPDARSIVEVIDVLTPEQLRLLGFERVWTEDQGRSYDRLVNVWASEEHVRDHVVLHVDIPSGA